MTELTNELEGTVRSLERTVLDYYEGWFDGDVERLRRALHPDLVKRQAGERLGQTTAGRLLDLAAAGQGADDRGEVEVVVEDVHDDIATVTVRGGPYHEYLHLVRTRDGWKIANALWQWR